MRIGLDFAAPSPGSREVLVLGHSLGTSAELWRDALPLLQNRFDVLRWELPGHGRAEPARTGYRVEDATDELINALDQHGIDTIHFVGVSISGCVGLDMCLRYPERMSTVTVISTGARVDDPRLMRERAVTAREEGVGALVAASRSRWFAPSTSDATARRILSILSRTDAESYGLAAEALADFDVWERLPSIDTPLLAVGGEEDKSVPAERSFELAGRVHRGAAVSIPDAGHSLVAENPKALSTALVDFIERDSAPGIR